MSVSGDAPAIELRRLSKQFGSLRAVDDISLRVEKGTVFGYLGPNGSGKTTTIRLMLALLRPTAGDVRLLGEAVKPGASVLSRVGSLVERPGFYPYLSALENLRLFAAARGMSARAARSACDDALARLGLSEAGDRRVGTFSTGMRQRLGLALALLDRPPVIVLDEPTAGMDPEWVVEVRELIRALAAEGATVFVSTHDLHEAEQTCTHVGIVSKGRLLTAGPVEQLLNDKPAVDVRFRSEDARSSAVALLLDHGLDVIAEDPLGCIVWGQADGDHVLAILSAAGLYPTEVKRRRRRLESAYLSLLREIQP